MSTESSHSSGFGKALTRELSDYVKRSGEILLSVCILVASMVAVVSIFSSEMLSDLPIAVVDSDNSSVSRSYIRMLAAAPEINVAYEFSSMEKAHEYLEQASVFAVVLIPHDFAKHVKTGRSTNVVAWHSGQFLTISGVLSKSLRQVTATMSAGIQITALKKRGDSSLAANVNFAPIQTELRTLFNPFQSYQYFLVASLLPTMLHVFVMIWTVFCVGREFQDNTSDRWLSSARTVFWAIATKVLPIFIISAMIAIGCLSWVHIIAGWPISGSAGLLLLGWALMILAYIALGTLCASVAPKLATALSAAVFLTAPAFAYTGITFPQQAMPLLAQIWSYALPIKTMLRLQVEQAQIGAPPVSSLLEIIILLAFIIVGFWLAGMKIKARSSAALGGNK